MSKRLSDSRHSRHSSRCAIAFFSNLGYNASKAKPAIVASRESGQTQRTVWQRIPHQTVASMRRFVLKWSVLRNSRRREMSSKGRRYSRLLEGTTQFIALPFGLKLPAARCPSTSPSRQTKDECRQYGNQIRIASSVPPQPNDAMKPVPSNDLKIRSSPRASQDNELGW